MDNAEIKKRECVNTMQNDEHQDLINNVNCEHTTHVHTVKTADFIENELVSDLLGTHTQSNNDVGVMWSGDADNVVEVDASIPNSDGNFNFTNYVEVESESEIELKSTNNQDQDQTENENESECLSESCVMEETMEVLEETKKEKFDIGKLNYELQVGYKILISLMGAGNRFVNKLFLNPVDNNFPETTDYYEKIKEPMWMYKMKQKFEELVYQDLTEFHADFKLMLENCYRYNGPDNFVSKKAQKLETMLKQKIALLSKELRAKIIGSASTEDEVLASAGIRRRVRNPNLAPQEDESQVLLSQLRRDKAMQQREDRRQRSEDKKALEAARIQEIQNWEYEFMGSDIKDSLRTMWELPQIGMFVYLCMESLGLEEEVTQYQLERGLIAPRESSDFRRLMTCLLSTQHQRKSVKSCMPYSVWNKKLSQKLDYFYKIFADCGGNHQQACYKLGFDNRAFKVMGKANPLLKKQFHQLSFLKRVWVFKNYCDFCVESQTYLQKTIEETELGRPMDVREVLLGSDGRGQRYVNFPMFTGKDIRIYRHPKLQEPSLSSLGLEDWSMVEEKPSASSSRCSTPVNQKGRYSEPQSSSLRARAILQAAESNNPSPVRASPDLPQDENSNSNPGTCSVTSETASTGKGRTSSPSPQKRKKRSGYSGKRKRLKTRKEALILDEFTNSPGTDKDDDGCGSVKGETNDNEDSQGFNVPKFNSNNIDDNDNTTNTCDINIVTNSNNNNSCDTSNIQTSLSSNEAVDTKFQKSEEATVVSSLSSESLSSSSLPLSSLVKSAKTMDTSSVVENGIGGKKDGNSISGIVSGEDKMKNGLDDENNKEKEDQETNPSENVVAADKNDKSVDESANSMSGRNDVNNSTSESSSDDKKLDKINSVGINNVHDSAYLSCDSGDKNGEENSSGRSVLTSTEEEGSCGEKSLDYPATGSVKMELEDMKQEEKVNGFEIKKECSDENDVKRNLEEKDCEESKVVKMECEIRKTAVKPEDSNGKEGKSDNSDKQTSDVKTENGTDDVKEEPMEEESDEEDLPDLGRIELVAESMEEIRNLMNKLSNPEPIKRGRRVYPGVMKPCEEELLENLTRFHDELVKYEKSLFNARVHAQIKLRKEVDNYEEPRVEESKGWESETSQSSKNVSDDEDGDTTTAAAGGAGGNNASSNKKEKLQKVSSTASSGCKKSKKPLTDFLSSAASKLETLNGDAATNEDSNDSYELDISSRGRLRKRRVIPNNTEDTLLKKRKNLNQESTATSESTVTPSSSSPLSSLLSSTISPSSSNIQTFSQSQILSMLASSQQQNLVHATNKQPNPAMPCQIVRFISPSGDATGYKTVRLVSGGAGGQANMVLASPEKFAAAGGGNIQFVSSSGIVTIPRNKLLASSLSSTTPQSSHPVIQNLLKSHAKGATNQQLLFQKNLNNLSPGASGILKQQIQGLEQQQQQQQQRVQGKMLSSNVRMTTSQTVLASGIPIGSPAKQAQPGVALKKSLISSSSASLSSTPAAVAATTVVVTQVSNSFVSHGGKQVLDLGNLSMTQIQQLVKNQAIQINTGAGNSTTLLLTTGLQQHLSNASKGSLQVGVGGVGGVAASGATSGACTTLASAGGVGLKSGSIIQHSIKVPAVQNMAGFPNATLLGKTLTGQQHMTVIPKNNLNNSQHQPAAGLPVIRTIINRPALNAAALRTTLPSSSSVISGQNINMPVMGINNQQQQRGLFTVVSGVGAAAALKSIPTNTTAQGIVLNTNNSNTNQSIIRMSGASSIIGQTNNLIPAAVNLNNNQQLFTIVSGGTALKQIPPANPRIISSLNNNQRVLFSSPSTSLSQGLHQTSSNINSTNIKALPGKENPMPNNSNVLATHSDSKPASPSNTLSTSTISSFPNDSQPKPNWVTIPTKKYAGNVTVKALLENRNNATKKGETNEVVSSASDSSCAGRHNESALVVDGKSNGQSETNLNMAVELAKTISSTSSSSSLNGSDGNASVQQQQQTDVEEEVQTSQSLPSSSSSVSITQCLTVDAAIQPLLVSSVQVTLPTVNIKVPSPNTLPSLTHNKHSTTIVQSTKVPIPVAATVDTNLSPIIQFSNTANGSSLAVTALPLPLQQPTSQQNMVTTTTNTITQSNSSIATSAAPPQPLKSSTQTVLNVNNLNISNHPSANSISNANVNAATSATPTDLKNVMLKLTPPKGGTGQFVQGYMTSQGKLVIPQTALFPQPQCQQQAQQQVLQAGPTRVILASNNTNNLLSSSQQSQQILQAAAAKLPSTALIGATNNGASSQIRIAAPNNNINNNLTGSNNNNNQTPSVQIVGQQPTNQMVLASNAAQHQQQLSGSVQIQQQNQANSARAIQLQSGNPGIKLMLINPSAVSGLQNNNGANVIQNIQQQSIGVKGGAGSVSGPVHLMSSSSLASSQQNHPIIQTSTPASELVKQIAANSSQLQAVQQLGGTGSNNSNSTTTISSTATNKPIQVLQQQAIVTNPTILSSSSQGQGNPIVSPLAQILTLQQHANKLQTQQLQSGQIILAKHQQTATSQQQQQPGAISLQLQNVNQLLSSQNVSIRGLTPQQIQIPNAQQLQPQQGAQGLLTTPKPIPQAQMLQLAVNAQTANINNSNSAGAVVAQPRVVQVAGQLSPQIQLANQSPLQTAVVPQQMGLIIQQQQQQQQQAPTATAVLQPGQQLMGAPGSNMVQLQHNNTIIQQPKVVAVQQQAATAAPSSISINQQQHQQQKQGQQHLLTNPSPTHPPVIRPQQQQLSLPAALSATNPILQNQSANQAQIQFLINPSVSVSTANMARIAKPVIHPVIRAVSTCPATSLSSSSSSSLSWSPSSNQLQSQLIKQTTLSQPIVMSQSLPQPASSASSNQFLISPVKLATHHSPQTPQGNPQTRLINNPFKLVTSMQTILPQQQSVVGSSSSSPLSLTDQRTSQLVIQNTSQLHSVIQTNNNTFIPPSCSNPNTNSGGLSFTDAKMVKTGNVLASKIDNSSSSVNPSLCFKPQNVVVVPSVAAAVSSSSWSQHPLPGSMLSVNGSDVISSSNGTGTERNPPHGLLDKTDGPASIKQQQQTIRRNTFSGSQEGPKPAMVQRQKSVDDGAALTTEENDEKEAALNLLTLANQPL